MSGFKKAKYTTSTDGLLQQALANRLSGQALKDKRMEFSLLADRIGKEKSQGRSITLTRVFPAKTIPEDGFWEKLDAAYLALHSTQTGSLYDFLMTLHARRFRLFPKIGARQAFVGLETIRATGIDDRIKQSGILDILPEFNSQILFDALTTQMRGKGEETSVEPLLKRFVLNFGCKALPTDTQDYVLPAHSMLQAMAQALVDEFKHWRDMSAAPDHALSIVEAVINKQGYAIRGLPMIADAYSKVKVLCEGVFAKSTFHYDPSRFSIPTEDKSERFYLICASYAHEALNAGTAPDKYAQEMISTTNANGLAWLFSEGITLLQQSNPDDIAASLGVVLKQPDQVEDLMALIKAAKAYQAPAYFPEMSARSTRVYLKGAIDSMISNHLKRARALYDGLEKEVSQSDDYEIYPKTYQPYFENTAISASEYNRGIKWLVKNRNNIRTMLARLCGVDAAQPGTINADIALYNQYRDMISQLAGTLEMVNNHIEIAQTNGRDVPDKLVPPEWLVKPEALVKIHDRIIDPSADRAQVHAEYQGLDSGYTALIRQLTERYQLGFNKTLQQRSDFIERLMREHPKKYQWATPDLLARREILGKITYTVYRADGAALRRKLLDWVKDVELIPLDANQYKQTGKYAPTKAGVRDWTKHINEGKGRIYINPKDKALKRLVPIDNEKLQTSDLFGLIEFLVDTTDISPRDQAILTQTHHALLLQGLPESIHPHDLDAYVQSQCAPVLRPLMTSEYISRSNAIKAISTSYQSKLSGLLYKLNKTRFIDTRSVCVWDTPALVYVPRAKNWKVPPRYYDGVLADIIETYGVFNDEGMDVLATAKALAKALSGLTAKDGSTPESHEIYIRKLLLQMPHGWGVVLDIENWGEPSLGLLLNNRNVVAKQFNIVPITVPLAFAKDIDRVLIGESASPPRLIFTRSYEVKNNVVTERVQERKVSINLPITISSQPAETPWYPDYILGVDPGEFGLGLGLVNMKGEMVDSAFVSMPQVLAFRHALNSHRVRTTPRQKYKAMYSTHLEERKDSAAGDMISLVENLMYKLNALPVIEKVDSRGNNKISQITDRLIEAFCWGENDAQNSARTAHWFGASRWQTGFVRVETGEDYRVYPGASVGSFGNSQQCPICKRNALQSLRQMIEVDGVKQLDIDAAGGLPLADGHVTVYGINPHTFEDKKRRNRAPDYDPISKRQFDDLGLKSQSYKDLRAYLMNSLWRQNNDLRSKQSRQSVYHCLYTDCGYSGNSEASAGINIARKFLSRVKMGGDVKYHTAA